MRIPLAVAMSSPLFFKTFGSRQIIGCLILGLIKHAPYFKADVAECGTKVIDRSFTPLFAPIFDIYIYPTHLYAI